MKTENASERLHLSLVNLPRDYENPNPGEYTFDERALGKGTWVVIINTGFNWEQFPEVSSTFSNHGRSIHSRLSFGLQHASPVWRRSFDRF